MTEDFSIRLARGDEVARLGYIEDRAAALFESTDIAEDLNGEVYDPDDLAELIDQGQVWAACFDDDVPVGFVIVLKYDDILHIEELDVLPEFGRRGIGTALVEHACAWAAANGYFVATLSTFRDVSWNAPFYSRHAFRILDALEFTPWMIRLREIEESKGLRIETRVIMRRELS